MRMGYGNFANFPNTSGGVLAETFNTVADVQSTLSNTNSTKQVFLEFLRISGLFSKATSFY